MSDMSELFTTTFNHPNTLEIPFNREWSNGTGYFDAAVSGPAAPIVQAGLIVKSKTTTGRRIMIVGTRLGNVVIFDRYDGQSEKPDDAIFCFNTTTAVSEGGWLSDGSSGRVIDFLELSTLLGQYYDGKNNLGYRINQIYSACQKSTQAYKEAQKSGSPQFLTRQAA